MATALISLGSNIGDRAAALHRALQMLALESGVRIAATSTFHETKPAGGPASQEKFLNAAALLETELPPRELFLGLQNVEQQLGRVRSEWWGPRTIDLDLLLYDQLEIDTSELTIPHPRMSFRRFVLEPAAEIAAEMVHPICGNTIGGLLRHLDQTPRWIFVTDASHLDLTEIFARCDSVRTVRADVFPLARALPEQLTLVTRTWTLTNNQRVLAALNASPQKWVISDWWDPLERWRHLRTRPPAPSDELLRPRLLLVAENRIDDLKAFIREQYRGPTLWLEGCTCDQIRDEILASIAAME